MPNSSGTWKTGERVLTTATYDCLNCRQLGKATPVVLQEGALFPYCSGCDMKDNTYKILSGKK